MFTFELCFDYKVSRKHNFYRLRKKKLIYKENRTKYIYGGLTKRLPKCNHREYSRIRTKYVTTIGCLLWVSRGYDDFFYHDIWISRKRKIWIWLRKLKVLIKVKRKRYVKNFYKPRKFIFSVHTPIKEICFISKQNLQPLVDRYMLLG